VFWNSIQASDDPAMFDAYLRQFPNGSFVELARAKAGALRQPKPVPAASPTAAQVAAAPPVTPNDFQSNRPQGSVPPPAAAAPREGSFNVAAIYTQREVKGTYVVTSFKASPQKRTRRGGRRRSSQSTSAAADKTTSERSAGDDSQSKKINRPTSVESGSDGVARTAGPVSSPGNQAPEPAPTSATRRKKSGPRKKSGRKATTSATPGNTNPGNTIQGHSNPRSIDTGVISGNRRSGAPRRRSRSRPRLPEDPQR